MPEITDEKLIEQAPYAKLNLLALAVLASLVLAAVTLALATGRSAASAAGLAIAASVALVTAGYWALFVGAKRGNPLAVTFGLAFVSLQSVLLVVFYGIQKARGLSAAPPYSIVVLLLIGYMLLRSRTVLVRLKERGLWDGLFGSAPPSRRLCQIGGALLAIGLVGNYAASAQMASEANRQVEKDLGDAQAFLDMLRTEETEFARAVVKLSGEHGAEDVQAATEKLQALRQKTESIAQNVEEDSKLKEILASYMNAIDHWGRSIAIRAQPEPNPEAAIEQLRIGDNWRTKAGDGFNQFYARKRE